MATVKAELSYNVTLTYVHQLLTLHHHLLGDGLHPRHFLALLRNTLLLSLYLLYHTLLFSFLLPLLPYPTGLRAEPGAL